MLRDDGHALDARRWDVLWVDVEVGDVKELIFDGVFELAITVLQSNYRTVDVQNFVEQPAVRCVASAYLRGTNQNLPQPTLRFVNSFLLLAFREVLRLCVNLKLQFQVEKLRVFQPLEHAFGFHTFRLPKFQAKPLTVIRINQRQQNSAHFSWRWR